ncbi:MAG: type II secretion system protein GspM [Gemmatimonadaceae bacterium]
MLVIGAASIVALIIGARVPAVLAWKRDVRAESEEGRLAVQNARAVLGAERGVRDSAVARGRRVIALAPLLLSGDTPASASASLEGIISGAAASSNVQLGALEMRADSITRSEFTRIVVKGSANGDIQGLAHMLQQLEQGPALLAVEELSITQPELNGAADHMESLHMEIVIDGLMLSPAAAVAK